MKHLMSFAKICLLASLLAACEGCCVHRQIVIRVNTNTGKEDVIVHKGDTVEFVTQTKDHPPIRFKSSPPCEARDLNGYELKDGFCHVSVNGPGDFVYDCEQNCADPDMPVRSNTKPLHRGQVLPAAGAQQPCFNRTVLLQLPTTANTKASDSVPAGSCVLWESSISSDVTISGLMVTGCTSSYTGTDSDAGPCDLTGATSPVNYKYTEGTGTAMISSTGSITITSSAPPTRPQ